ncbi:hypothetical protein ACQ4LE_004439 [Meloidogyne hapla]
MVVRRENNRNIYYKKAQKRYPFNLLTRSQITNSVNNMDSAGSQQSDMESSGGGRAKHHQHKGKKQAIYKTIIHSKNRHVLVENNRGNSFERNDRILQEKEKQ